MLPIKSPKLDFTKNKQMRACQVLAGGDNRELSQIVKLTKLKYNRKRA